MQIIYLLLYLISIIVGFIYTYDINGGVITIFVILNVMLSLRVIANIIQANDMIKALKSISDEKPSLFVYCCLYGQQFLTIIVMISSIQNMLKYEGGLILALEPLSLLVIYILDKFTFTNTKGNSQIIKLPFFI